MAKLEYRSKSLEYTIDGVPKNTKVIIGSDDGALIPVLLPPTVIDFDSDKLLNLAMDEFFNLHFASRYSKKQFDDLNQKIENETNQTKKELVDQQNFLNLVADILATAVPNLFSHQYRQMMAFIPKAVSGITYPEGSYVTVPHDDKFEDSGEGSLVLVKVMTSNGLKYSGETYEQLKNGGLFNRGGINFMPYAPQK